MKTTKAEFLRWLTPGKRVRLINSLMGPCSMARTVAKVTGQCAQFTTERGSTSYLHLSKEEHVEKTAKGYRIVLTAENKVAAEYEEV